MKLIHNDSNKAPIQYNGRLTRARANSLETSKKALPPPKTNIKHVGKENSKRHLLNASEENPKRRAVLQDITNRTKTISRQLKSLLNNHARILDSNLLKIESERKEFTDIDTNSRDVQLCSIYASDIHKQMCIQELDNRPLTSYMEILQQDITSSMRAILIDWLVEVSEEYKLVPDTLYLTVNLLDRFLSFNQIGKHKLQLLGVTCMLIASKYEEICSPRVNEFCFITDNTYTKEEVLECESKVLNFLNFRISVATTKTFLRRFIFASQSISESPSQEFEFLANFLAELTLLEYEFLKFFPSIIAASAVFLARWTLNPNAHPWNPTLEHYTSYKALELKKVVLALEDLLRNTANSPLIAVREKYKQPSFKSVANLSALRSVASIF